LAGAGAFCWLLSGLGCFAQFLQFSLEVFLGAVAAPVVGILDAELFRVEYRVLAFLLLRLVVLQ